MSNKQPISTFLGIAAAVVLATNVHAATINVCPTDTNGDGVTNVLDLIDLLLCFGQPAIPGCESEDVNGDAVVNVLDLIDLLLTFGTTCPQRLAYGVRLEKGELWAFIEVAGGPELIAAPFDPVTEEEDHERARLIGLTVPELEGLIGQPNDKQVALLQSATVSRAGDLWKADLPFPDFDGTEGQRQILGTLSAILRLMHLKVSVIDPPWTPNGCTGPPCFVLRAATVACCNTHDECYCDGGKESDRLACDNAFLACIILGGHPKTAALFYAAVRALGASHFNFTPC